MWHSEAVEEFPVIDWRGPYEPPELVEGELVEFTLPARPVHESDHSHGWRSLLLCPGAWLWMHREVDGMRDAGGKLIEEASWGTVRAFLFLSTEVARGVVLSLAVSGSSAVIDCAERYLQEEVGRFRQDERAYVRRWPRRIPGVRDITGELRIARLGFFPYSYRRLRTTVPAYVVDELFGGVGGVVEPYLALRELSVFSRSDLDSDFIYYSLLTGVLRWGDKRLQFIELVRSISPTQYRDFANERSSAWRRAPRTYVWDLLDREIRAGPYYVASMGRLFDEDWGAWWSSALLCPRLIKRYYE
ncbi:hypothetical protein CBR_g49324 [Chara braunii]|uniref:Uncharacterized protein n=1 Tax=Chara braunii TaxID=69332 RepID=A0A388M4X3_CHABU|nr:hypothetical protein CBR_g49323 [Chara braunii]GBG89534.1 hypothetical protein CBR_g49324 [Chara braunii]|eukprot:GBG89533.1 hypothetical protein CBR_g49323 [Chara braunii]